MDTEDVDRLLGELTPNQNVIIELPISGHSRSWGNPLHASSFVTEVLLDQIEGIQGAEKTLIFSWSMMN